MYLGQAEQHRSLLTFPTPLCDPATTMTFILPQTAWRLTASPHVTPPARFVSYAARVDGEMTGLLCQSTG